MKDEKDAFIDHKKKSMMEKDSRTIINDTHKKNNF